MPSLKGSGFKNSNLRGVSLGREVVKPFFASSGQGCRIISDNLDRKSVITRVIAAGRRDDHDAGRDEKDFY
jgi:hypothetical protein